MKKFYLAFVLIYIFMFINLSAQDNTMQCMATAPENISISQIGGYLLPSEGTINVLCIFAQFPDDNFDTSNPTWVKGQAPVYMQGWVDQNWTTNPTQGSMTHYFNEMSFNKLKFTGKTVSVITPHSRQWYLDNNKKRGDIHKEIIQQLDQTWDFAQFDNWNFEGYYNHINQPDGVVDMIFIVWRNIGHEYPTSPTDSVKLIYNKLNMGRYGDLGYGWPDIIVDNGQRVIKMGFWPDTYYKTPGGSGATMTDWFSENMFRFSIHEFGHYLEGGNDQHAGYGFWGMLSGWGVKNFVASAFERHRLGWINLGPNTILASPNQTIENVNLPDFVTSGIAYKLVINAATNEYFYIENHQKFSFWENNQMFLRSPYGNVENGVYVLRQEGASGDNTFIKCLPADGRWNWTVNQLIANPWGAGDLPVFKKLGVDRVNGYQDLQFIPWTWNGVPQTAAPIHFTENENGQPVLDIKNSGDGKDAFRLEYNELWSPYSNPNSQKLNKAATPFGFKINGFNSGVASLDYYVGTSLDGPPSKPQNLKLSILYNHPVLTWEANIEPDLSGYNIYRSENGGTPELIGFVSQASRKTYTDYSANTSLPTDHYDYTIKTKDNTNLLSIPSDKVSVMALAPKIKVDVSEKIPSEYTLAQNYPNPFNPSTNIVFSIKENGFVLLKVYDILGKEVATLVNEQKPAGNYEVEFDASTLSSGMYIYKIQSGNFIETKKMLLMK